MQLSVTSQSNKKIYSAATKKYLKKHKSVVGRMLYICLPFKPKTAFHAPNAAMEFSDLCLYQLRVLNTMLCAIENYPCVIFYQQAN